MKILTLCVRTPQGLAFEGPVHSIRAEDLSGWFGILPGRRDMVAALPVGLLIFKDDEGEAFVAHAGGLLDLERNRCRVISQDALIERQLSKVETRVTEMFERRQQRDTRMKGALVDLINEAMRRMAVELKT